MTLGQRLRKYLTAGVVLSALLHFLVTGWGLFAFARGTLEAPPEDIVPVDVISDDKLTQMMKGLKTGDKNATQQQADKIGDPNQKDPSAAKIDDKKPPIEPSADKQQPKPDDKPIEKKPDPPKPVAQDKPKDEPKPAKEEPKIDQIAEKLKQQDQPQKDPRKPEAKQTPQPPKPQKQYAYNATDVKALLDKRDPSRQSITGAQANPKSALGVPAAPAQKLTLGWVPAFKKRIQDCWAVPAGIRDGQNIEVRIYMELNPNGMLAGHPIPMGGSANAFGPAVSESAIRAIEQCQPYAFLPPNEYKGGWDKIDMVFSTSEMFNR